AGPDARRPLVPRPLVPRPALPRFAGSWRPSGGPPGERSRPVRGRGQTTPIAALVALFAVCAGLSLYATTLGAVTPKATTDRLADPTLDRVYDVVSDGGVVDPTRLSRGEAVAPDGYRVAVSVAAATSDRRWRYGPHPPGDGESGSGTVDRATRPVSVQTRDGAVVWGRLTVRVWR
ncbi:MAG: hypothetical protein ABEK02_01735, partial [Haloquadratum sp.]